MLSSPAIASRRLHKLWRILAEPVYRRALRHRVAAAVEHDTVPYGADFRTVVDVGANRGQFALVAARRFPSAALWCFEPLPSARTKLRAVLGSRPHTTILGTALAAHPGEHDMHVTRHDDSSSLHAVGHRQLEEFPGTDEVSLMRVTTARLDELLTQAQIVAPALLKLDVQGSELEVLQGAGRLLGGDGAADASVFHSILVECSFVELYVGQSLATEVISFLNARGWHLSGAYNVTYGAQGVCLQADLLFSR
jgi:FkbM family methyltransferase